MQTFYSPDYHTSNHLAPVVNSSSLIPASGNSPPSTAIANNSGCLTKFNDIDALNSSYPTYNNWSNGYNNYQYAATPTAAVAATMQTPAQAQYATAASQVPHHTAPAMLIYPQVYSTVNQNQIHLHLHGTDKIEQYLQHSNENGLTLSAGARNATVTEIGMNGTTPENQNVIMDSDDNDAAHHHQQQHQQQQQQHQHHRSEHDTSNHRDEDVGDPSSVWRPY